MEQYYENNRNQAAEGIPESMWSREVRAALGKSKFGNNNRVVFAYGTYNKKFGVEGIVMVIALIVFLFLIIFGVPIPNMPMRIGCIVLYLITASMALMSMIRRLGEYTYIVTNASFILYKNERNGADLDQWAPLNKESQAYAPLQQKNMLQIHTNGWLTITDAEKREGKRDGFVLYYLGEEEQQKIIDAVSAAADYNRIGGF